MSGGGGKGGSETTKTEVPDWIKQPAIRNLQRAEDVQRIEYMPYRGPEVAAFNATQNAAMNNNIGAAEAFGLLGANHGLTAQTGMPTPTDFNGFSGYSSMPIYDQALADTKAAQPDAVAQYDALFGQSAMANLNRSRYGGGGGGGNADNGGFNRIHTTSGFDRNAANNLDQMNRERGKIIAGNPDQLGEGDKEGRLNYQKMMQTKSLMDNQAGYQKAAGVGNYAPVAPRSMSSRFDSKGYTPKK